MARLGFDIETSALPLEQFDEAQQEYLFRECEKITDESARATRHAEIQQQFNLWPFTAQVVCIAMLNADTSRGQVLFTAADYEEAAGRFNLDFYCKAFGIESPKAQGVTGSDVNTLMAEGRHRDIAEYCLRDVKATVLLYHVWRERLAGVK